MPAKIDNFPYTRLGLDKTLAEVREAMFGRLDEVHAEYIGKGWLPAALNLNRGPARGMIELANWGRHRINQDITALIPQCFAAYATGAWMDLHAADVLLARREALQAQGTVVFSRLSPSGGNIKIPAGRLVRTRPDGLGEIYRFVTTEDVILPENELTVAVPVIAENYGQAANVTAGAICEIVTAVSGIDTVTNAADWLTREGADEEDDESLRHRYFLKWMSISGLNKYFYESLAFSVAGVDAVKVHDRHPRGQGTVDVYVKGAAGLPTQGLLDQVTAAIEAEKPQIDDFLVKAPEPVPTAVRLVLEITEGDHDAVKAQVENRVRAMFQTPAKGLGVALLDIGEDLTHSRLHFEALKSLGVKKVRIESPAEDLTVAMGGLALLESLSIESEAVDA
jgi:uncharacterized phage protein gp47/JayE